MELRTKVLYLAAFLVIALPLALTRDAGAGYYKDGAVQNGVTGEWITPNDMVCIVGLHPDGTLDIADGVTNRRDCDYLTTGTMNGGTPFDLRGMTTQDQCTKAGSAGNDGARHAWATSICVDSSGNGISLKDLDRTSQMCTARGGTWVTSGRCTTYNRQFRGQDDNGTPLLFGPKGTSQADAGFCYASMRMTTASYGSEALCPSSSSNSSTKYDWSFPTTGSNANQCLYAKGIKGYLSGSLTKANGTSYTAGTFLDLSQFTTMGDCLANGGSWNNWVGQPVSTASVATTPKASTIPVFDYTTQTPHADNACLHCHSTLTQYNGPAERWKDSYLKHGHKNMLRKVTPGKIWAGPNEEGVITAYTAAATGPINFSTATASNIKGADRPLLYIFGDWMAPAPEGLDVVVDMGPGVGAKYNGNSDYSCAACHSTGWSNSNPAAGVCSLSSKTTSLACTSAGGIWYPMIGVQAIGTPGYTPAEPAASFPGISFGAAGQWNFEGITCARCHNATAPRVENTQIAASQFPSTHTTSDGMGALADGVGRANLCFGCHQSIAKTNNGTSSDNDLNHPENISVKNYSNTATDYAPEFNGHVIGNSFLNSPHARYTGKIVPNALGKYDLEDPTTCVGSDCTGGNNGEIESKFDSKFRGYACFQTPTSQSPAKTMIVDGVIKEIKTKADCENLYPGGWRVDSQGFSVVTSGTQLGTQGTCTTCHDVHNSLFVEETRERAFKKVCTDCHNKPFSNMAHLSGPGTPFDVAEPFEACVTCHMPLATSAGWPLPTVPGSAGFPMHLWRINTDVNYRTFPTAEEFGMGGATATKKIANSAPDDEGYASAVWVDIDYACGQCHGGSFGPSATRNNAPYFTKVELSQYAQDMHRNSDPTASFTIEGTASATSRLINMNSRTIKLTDTSTDDSHWKEDYQTIMLPDNAITVNWGDRSSSTKPAGSVFEHTYGKRGKYTIVYSVVDSDGAKTTKKIQVRVR